MAPDDAQIPGKYYNAGGIYIISCSDFYTRVMALRILLLIDRAHHVATRR